MKVDNNNMLSSLQADKSVSRQIESPMNACRLRIRAVSETDIERISDYFLKSDPDFLIHIGIDPKKVPFKIEFVSALMNEIKSRPEEKTSCHLIWELNDISIGHSNINKIMFSSNACLHLHIWEPEQRNIGNGTLLVKDSISYFLRFLISEVYIANRMR
ncbi:hypothetical protein [Desulfosarcina cetonica]|uniref:hypothetical protein n=1 Tax=Desulfosarcina cetonica TaxID=90730 RepID=UPI0012ED3431|nr:hypothetical protein [Desulfosarcina cetonica]